MSCPPTSSDATGVSPSDRPAAAEVPPREDAVARGKVLWDDPDYPSDSILRHLAARFVGMFTRRR